MIDVEGFKGYLKEQGYSAAVEYLKKQKKREDDLFYCFMYRW